MREIRRPDVPEAPGVYRIVHVESGCEYIGSAMNLRARRGVHRRQLEAGRHKNRRLQWAWLRDGAAAFRFDVLELTARDAVAAREQHHLDQSPPAGRYNVVAVAWSTRGYRHTPEAKARIGAASSARPRSAETKARASAANRGKKRSPEARAKMRAAKLGTKRGPQSPALIAKRVAAIRVAKQRRRAEQTDIFA